MAVVATGAKPSLPVSKDEIVRAVRNERRRTLAFVRTLSPDQFDVDALPGWRVREVLAHLITRDRSSVTGTILPNVFNPDRLESWNDKVVGRMAGRPPQDLIDGLERWGRRFARLCRTLPAAAYRLRMPTLYGLGPAGHLVWACAFDDFVHRQDIRRALGMEDEQVDVEPTAEFVLSAAGVGLPTRHKGMRGKVVVVLDAASLSPWTFDLTASGAGRGADEAADARITMAAEPFVMASTGRDGWDLLRERGQLKVEGDEDLAERFLGSLRVV